MAAAIFFAPLFLNAPVYAASGSFVISAAHVGQVDNDSITASIVNANGLTLTHKTIFNKLGWADYAITLKNDSRNTRRIDNVEIEDSDSDVIGYEIYKAYLGDYVDENYDDNTDSFTDELKPGDTFTLIVTIYADKDPTTPDETNISGDMKIILTYTDTEIGEEETEEIAVIPEESSDTPVEPAISDTPEVPETSETIKAPETGIFGRLKEYSSDAFLTTFSLIVMTAGLVACVILVVKKNPKAASRVAVVALSVIMLSPLTVHADDTATQLNMKGEIEVNTVLFMTIHYLNADSGEWIEDSESLQPGEFETIGDLFGNPTNWPAPSGLRAVKLVNTADNSDVPLDTAFNKSFDLTIVYEEIPVETYNITYNLNGGRKSSESEEYPSTYTNMQTTYLPSPVSDDYDFAGWLISNTESVLIFNTEGKTGDLDLIAQWREKPKTFYNITSMQEMTGSVCSTATTPKATASQFTSTYTTSTNLIPRTTLVDERDGNEYTVVKLADGRCWMAANLRLGGDEPVVLTPDDSDVNANWTLLASNPQFTRDENNVAFAMNETNGGYYNWYAATAGSGNDTYTNTTGRSIDYARYSICPKGWKLPSANNVNNAESDVRTLVNKYKGEPYIQNVLTALNITMTGTYSINPYTPTSFSSWSSATTQTTATLTLAYNPDYYGADTLAIGRLGENYGMVVRCVNK